ncbi:MAG: AraC family transcriptional regulator [Clostridia bacterium]
MDEFWNAIQTDKIILNGFFWNNPTKNWYIRKREIKDNLVTFCFSGKGTYFADGKSIEVKPGRIIVISHDAKHYATQDETDPIYVVAFRFSLFKNIIPVGAFYVDTNNINVIHSILSQMHRFIVSNTLSKSDKNVLDAYAKSLFSLMFINSQILLGGKSDQFMEYVNYTIEENTRKSLEIPFEKFVEECGSRYIFLKRFKEYNNTTYKNYVYCVKMDYAKFLLTGTKSSVKEISQILKYSDLYIFSNQFKRLVGISPKHYRSKMLTIDDNRYILKI